MWVFFVTARVYFAAVALTRATSLRRPTPPCGARRGRRSRFYWSRSAVVVGAIVRQFAAQPAAGASDIAVRLARTVSTGLPAMVLWPFAALVRPQLAFSVTAFFGALAGSLLVLAATTAWMLIERRRDSNWRRGRLEGQFASEASDAPVGAARPPPGLDAAADRTS